MKYQDYIIKNGKFIGRFEEMYRESNDIPWSQNRTAHEHFSDLDILILKHLKKRLDIQRVADVGCGLGHMTNRIAQEVFEGDVEIHGFDISRTAVDQASKSTAGIQFEAIDFLQRVPKVLLNNYCLVCCLEVLWYVMEDLDTFRNNIINLTNKYVYIRQSIPNIEEFYGQEVFSDTDEISKFWELGLKTLYKCQVYHENEGFYIHLFLSKI